MMIIGSIKCTIHNDTNYSCIASSCNNDDDGGTGTSVWGPCGQSYSGGDSTCLQYCGNSSGIVCAKRDFDCNSGDYTDSYYCSHALFTCLDPTALSLVIVGTVFFGSMTIISILLYFISANSAEEDSSPPIQPAVATVMEDEDEADPEAIASDVPIDRRSKLAMRGNPMNELD